MHDLTKDGRWKLKIEITYDRDEYGNPSSRRGKTGVGVWDNFSVASEGNLFRLDIGSLLEKENIGRLDPMQRSNGEQFSTIDNENDGSHTRVCAERYGGGWWYRNCYLFCGNCQLSKNMMIWNDGVEWEAPSDSAMWIKQEIDN